MPHREQQPQETCVRSTNDIMCPQTRLRHTVYEVGCVIWPGRQAPGGWTCGYTFLNRRIMGNLVRHLARAAGSWRVPQRVAGLPAKGARSPSFSSHSCARPPSKKLQGSNEGHDQGRRHPHSRGIPALAAAARAAPFQQLHPPAVRE